MRTQEATSMKGNTSAIKCFELALVCASLHQKVIHVFDGVAWVSLTGQGEKVTLRWVHFDVITQQNSVRVFTFSNDSKRKCSVGGRKQRFRNVMMQTASVMMERGDVDVRIWGNKRKTLITAAQKPQHHQLQQTVQKRAENFIEKFRFFVCLKPGFSLY